MTPMTFGRAEAPDRQHSTTATGSDLPHTRLSRLLDEAHAFCADDDIAGMNDLVLGLNEIRKGVENAEWQRLIADVVAPHPVRLRFHEDPVTRRAFEKPRGYAGDAELLDLIYRDVPYTVQLTRFGARLHAWCDFEPAAQSVRERRRLLAAAIDDTANERPGARILSLASGHLREAQASDAIQQRAVAELVAVDQDPESLATVAREQSAFNVSAIRSSVRRLLAAPMAHGTFDLAYAAGLYDYLEDDVAAALTAALFDTLRPGGRLIVANFAPELRNIGYMEAIMDWKLIYRDEASVGHFSSRIPAERIAAASLTRDTFGNVVYLSLRKV